jgi:hypothetical protein
MSTRMSTSGRNRPQQRDLNLSRFGSTATRRNYAQRFPLTSHAEGSCRDGPGYAARGHFPPRFPPQSFIFPPQSFILAWASLMAEAFHSSHRFRAWERAGLGSSSRAPRDSAFGHSFS